MVCVQIEDRRSDRTLRCRQFYPRGIRVRYLLKAVWKHLRGRTYSSSGRLSCLRFRNHLIYSSLYWSLHILYLWSCQNKQDILERIWALGRHKESWHLGLRSQYWLSFRDVACSAGMQEVRWWICFPSLSVLWGCCTWGHSWAGGAVTSFLFHASFLCYSAISGVCPWSTKPCSLSALLLCFQVITEI